MEEGGEPVGGEDSERLRKNGFVKGGIQQREGVSITVFRLTVRGISAMNLTSGLSSLLFLFSFPYMCEVYS